MLRHIHGRHSWSRLLSFLRPGSEFHQESITGRARGILHISRPFSAAPVPDEDLHQDSDVAAAAHNTVHERLVFELFNIREKVKERFNARSSTNPKGVDDQRLRRQDPHTLYIAPLRQLLSGMHEYSQGGDSEILRQWERQIDSEANALQRALVRYQETEQAMKQRGEAAELPPARRLIVEWFQPLRDALKRDQQGAILKDDDMTKGRHVYAPFLLLLPPEQLAVITLNTIISSMMIGERNYYGKRGTKNLAGASSSVRIAMEIGRAVQRQVSLDQVRLRMEQEDSKKKWVTERLKQILDEDTVRALKAGGPVSQMLYGIEMRTKLEKGFDDVLASPDLPEEVREWLESIEGLSLEERVAAIRTRHRQHQNKYDHRMRYGRIKLGQAEKKLWRNAEWTQADHVKIGTALIHFLMENAFVTVRNPKWGKPGAEDEPRFVEVKAFELEYLKEPGKPGKNYEKVGKIVCHEVVMRRLCHNLPEYADLLMPKFRPMLVPPLPWRSYDSGGHLVFRTDLMRLYQRPSANIQALETAQERPPFGLSRVFDALNSLGEVAWAINKPVLEIAEKAWAQQLRIPGLPIMKEQKARDKPTSRRFRVERGSGGRQLQLLFTDQETRAEKLVRTRANNKIRKKLREMHSMRCDLNLKLGVAQEFKDEPRFYFPHNLDFRGRAYPLHPHLNHMGQDICRGLLTFADARPLQQEGLDWLYVMIANSWGKTVDKLDFAGRRRFVQDNLEAVLDSAERPLDGHRWWMRAEKPWQLLAACMEVRNALASGNPAAYLSRLPVQTDGSCNGLQHYAALGRDWEGGNAVNLRPNPAPQDVYSEIAAAVTAAVDIDAANGVPEAVALKGHVTRKLVKQTVMTSVYGVTFIGARQQISKQLLAAGWADDEIMYRTSMYAARMVLQGLEEKFKNAIAIMRWLAQTATVVASGNNAVAWHTPLGLPVIQPYREQQQYAVVTVLQRIILRRYDEKEPVRKRQQRSAFPPNYVHSLDSTHMMMTALACKKEGIAFAGVHDSFWTHAGDMPVLAQQLRRTFLELHSQPLLEQLLAELKERFPALARRFPPIPEFGKLDLNEILDAEYFFN